MEIPIKKLNSGFELPVFGIGTWEMGGRIKIFHLLRLVNLIHKKSIILISIYNRKTRRICLMKK
jgi:hypothetical protein